MRRTDICAGRDSNAVGASLVSEYAVAMGIAACVHPEEDRRWL